jgi:hypothetical protein
VKHGKLQWGRLNTLDDEPCSQTKVVRTKKTGNTSGLAVPQWTRQRHHDDQGCVIRLVTLGSGMRD